MRFAEHYNRWIMDKENLKYYKLKYAAQLGDDASRLAFNYTENEGIKHNGVFYGTLGKYHTPQSEKLQI
jgi:hypothetical protein